MAKRKRFYFYCVLFLDDKHVYGTFESLGTLDNQSDYRDFKQAIAKERNCSQDDFAVISLNLLN